MVQASAFSDFILSFAKMVGSALNLEYKSHGGVCATRRLHKLLRTADRICSVPREDPTIFAKLRIKSEKADV